MIDEKLSAQDALRRTMLVSAVATFGAALGISEPAAASYVTDVFPDRNVSISAPQRLAQFKARAGAAQQLKAGVASGRAGGVGVVKQLKAGVASGRASGGTGVTRQQKAGLTPVR